ncbi:MAG: AAA family ATPase [Arcicella sp.]|nr:AAA family ATPase [Arcicella sp.]
MKKILILRGLPASGKSTYARKLLAENLNAWKRLNKDELRAMLDDSAHTPANEQFINRVRDMLLMEALKARKNVIIDDTNLTDKPIEQIKNIAKKYTEQSGVQVHIEIKDMETSLEECLERDAVREKKVGSEVIMQMYRTHILKNERGPHYQEQDDTLPQAIICDLDGTLAILHDRGPHDSKRCETDLLNIPVAEIIKTYHEKGVKIILMSGREDNSRSQTMNWLSYNRIPYHALYMRETGDIRKDAIIKKELYEAHVKDQFYVQFVLDDRNQVVDLWRMELGLLCLQVNYGDF